MINNNENELILIMLQIVNMIIVLGNHDNNASLNGNGIHVTK